MTVLTIRAHRRYAVRQTVRLTRDGDSPATGLLIELSAEGMRISNLGAAQFAVAEEVAVEIGDVTLGGRIRWASNGVAGVRLDRALYVNQLNQLLDRGRDAEQDLRRYGT